MYYSQRGLHFDQTELYNTSYSLNVNYLEIPVLIKYKLPFKWSVKPALFAGPYLAFKLSANRTLDIWGERDTRSVPGVNNLDYGIVLAINSEFSAWSKQVMLEFRFNWGLANMMRQPPEFTSLFEVVKDDTIVWQKYYGYADVGSQRPADSNTIYGLASVSKLVVVTAVMQLREQGLINLDADVNAYLPFAVRNPHYPDEKITPYHLLTHTSGLNWPENDREVPGFYEQYPLDSAPPLSNWLPEFLLPGGAHYVPAVWINSRPGEREWYSNMGVSLLAYLVEVVSQMDYIEYCKQHIFQPLEMFNTSYAYADLDMNNLATLYDDPSHSIEFYRYLGYPSGNLKSTMEDFSH